MCVLQEEGLMAFGTLPTAQRDVLAPCLLLASHAGWRWDLSWLNGLCIPEVSVSPVKAEDWFVGVH